MKTVMTTRLLTATLLAAAGAAQAGGPLYLNDNPANPQPLRWATGAGPVKVYTDVGDFSRRNDGSTFLTETEANAITAFALQQWSAVPTSTWRADTKNFTRFTDVAGIGADVNDGATAARVYGQFLEGGIYVIYDVDGKVLEEVFGVPRDQVLGIAMPEFAEDTDGDGYPDTITKATALMNGWMVSHETPPPGQRALPPADVNGARFAGVFTHEFGHALNLSHSQVNGPLAFQSRPGAGRDLYPGVAGCVAPVHHWLEGPNASHIDPKHVETMFPFIDPASVARGRSVGLEMSTVEHPDDVAALSNLYPTADYASTTGSISGRLLLKDGVTGYSGINVVVRNVANPLGDAVSAMSGDQTQGLVGPDGRFRINNLKPGQRYLVYIETITAGGYPTAPTLLVSQAEYWNAAESNLPNSDSRCAATAMTAQAGTTAQADIRFNGHTDGVQYTFLTSGYLTSLSEDGKRAGGSAGEAIPLLWDAQNGASIPLAELELMASAMSSISGDGQRLLVQANFDGRTYSNDWGDVYKIKQMALWNIASGKLTPLGALSDKCGLGGTGGFTSSYGWGMNADATAAVGASTLENPDGSCKQFDWSALNGPDIVPYLWTADGGSRALSLNGLDVSSLPWIRAQAVGGNAAVILAQANFSRAFAWLGATADPIDLTALVGAYSAELANRDGSRVPLSTPQGTLIWNALQGTAPAAFRNISAPKFCIDMPFSSWDGIDYCATQGAAWVEANFGLPGLLLTSISDDGTVLLARVGSFFTGFSGFMWVDGAGWLKLNDFFRQQGVTEAEAYGMDNPLAVSGRGNAIVGGLTGAAMSWHVGLERAFVCQGGVSSETAFPAEFAARIQGGAKSGRCENL